MPRASRLVAVVLLLLVAGVRGAWAEEPPSLPPDAPSSLEALNRALGALAQRVGALIEIAKKDPRHALVDSYLAQTEEGFKERDRVKAKDLVEIMENPEASDDVRERAKEALASNAARSYDPDLLVERGQTKPRNNFCQRHLVPMLKVDDPVARTLAQDLMLLYFREAQRDPSIGMFKPQSATKGQRDRAYKAWKRFLRK